MRIKDFFISFLSALVQYYEYHLFGYIAAQIGRTFFPAADSATMLFKVYAFMFIAVCAKPIGAVILGKIGDVCGRQKAISLAIFITAASSITIGSLPGYELSGGLGIGILLFMRMCIASCASAGSDGVRIHIYETIAPKWKNCGAALGAVASITGSFLASYSAWFFTLNTFAQYYWRLSLFAGSILAIIVLLLRIFIAAPDSRSMHDEKEYAQYKSMPIMSIIMGSFKIFVLCLILAGCIGATYVFNFSFLATYYFEVLKIVDHSLMQYYRSIGLLLYMIFALIGGILSDLIGAKRVFIPAALSVVGLEVINCYLLNQNILSISLYLTVCALLPMVSIPSLTLLKSSVPKVIRYRIFSLCHSIGSIVISAPCSAISIFLYQASLLTWLPICYFIAIMLVMLLCLNALQNTQNRDIS